ncbi:hypothetical protein ACFL54_01830 [Planctomycetota bacterium]
MGNWKSLILLLALIMLAGCTYSRDPSAGDEEIFEPKRLAISHELQFDDIPVPVNFEYESKTSFIYKHENVRVGKLVYTGREELFDVIRFYEENMPASGWGNGSTRQFGNIANLHFEKQVEVAEITAQREGGHIIITIQVTPAK